MDDFRPAHDAADHGPKVVLGFGGASLHAVAGLDALFGCGNALVFDGLGGGTARGDQPSQFVGSRSGHEDMHRRVVLAGGPRLGQHAGFARSPAVAHPHGDALAAGEQLSAEVEVQLAGFLGVAVEDLDAGQRSLDGLAQPFGTLDAHGGRVVDHPVATGSELGFPVAAFLRLQAVLVVQLHQRAGVHQFGQERRQAAAQGGAVACQVLHQQVGQHLWIGANPAVHAGVAGQLADQEHQRAQARFQDAVVAAVVQADDGLVDFAQQGTGVEQIGGELIKQKIRRHHGAERLVRCLADGLVDDSQLRTQLAGRSSAVHGAQSLFPEASAHRQQRVVGRQNGRVLAAGCDPGAVQLAVDFAGVGVQHGADVGDAVFALGQHHAADDGLHVVVRELHVDGEAALQPLQAWRGGECGLAGAEEEQAVAEPFAARFGHFLHHVGALGVLADVLLHLVQDDDGIGQAIVARRKRIVQAVRELIGGDVLQPRELLAQQGPRGPLRGGEVGIRGQ